MSGRRRIANSLLAALLLAVLAGCSTATFDAAFGGAVEQNRSAHRVDPTPAPVDRIDHDGARAALAIDRYKAARVTPPAAEAVDEQIR
jgi:hypothetical protein